jgi:hypothetical protein
MDWVFKNLQIIIAAAGVVAWWLSQRKAGQSPDVEPHPDKTFEDPELAERTRRIREEIQRKIEQRARGYAHEQPTVPRSEPAELPPVMREVVVRRQPEPPPRTRAAATQQDARRMAEILEQQATLAEQLKQAQEMKAATLRRTQFETEIGSKEEVAAGVVRRALGDDLRDPAALRRAFILREVLGPPVALR